uniref:Uncharacterized protein n=1 Tax=Schistosoma mansoni TaxID=6183 RepID=A0AA82N7S8_SCHMA
MTKKSRDDLLSFLKAVGKNYESRNFLEKDNEFSSVVSDLVFELGKSHDVSSNVYPLTGYRFIFKAISPFYKFR